VPPTLEFSTGVTEVFTNFYSICTVPIVKDVLVIIGVIEQLGNREMPGIVRFYPLKVEL
jgi:hypothetical protein